jgi:hypothetical protein
MCFASQMEIVVGALVEIIIKNGRAAIRAVLVCEIGLMLAAAGQLAALDGLRSDGIIIKR